MAIPFVTLNDIEDLFNNIVATAGDERTDLSLYTKNTYIRQLLGEAEGQRLLDFYLRFRMYTILLLVEHRGQSIQ